MEPMQRLPWLTLALLTLCAPTRCRYTYPWSSDVENLHIPYADLHDDVPVKQQGSDSDEQISIQQKSVVVRCHEDSMEVVVQADLFDTGIHVDGRFLHLGSDSEGVRGSCGAFPSGEAQFTIHIHLGDCGTSLSSTKEKLIYSNVVVYTPKPSSDGLLRLDGVSIPVECRYERRYAVDSVAVHPTWVPFSSVVSAKDQIDFNLELKTDDWQFERGSHVYFLGDPIHLEVSVTIGSHMPLRVYVDHCVATATPNTDAILRYDFIKDNGCLVDAYLTRSRSRFLPRAEEDKLQFQLDAFRFYQEPSNVIYITCTVKAVPVQAVSSRSRACSFIENRWQSVDWDDEACQSCGDPKQFKESKYITPQPAMPGSNANAPKQESASYFRFRPSTRQSQPKSSSSVKRAAGLSRTSHLGPLVILHPSEALPNGNSNRAALRTTAPREQ